VRKEQKAATKTARFGAHFNPDYWILRTIFMLKSNFVMPSSWPAERLRVPRGFEGRCAALLCLELSKVVSSRISTFLISYAIIHFSSKRQICLQALA
jgi:hypothetical protein